MEHAGEFKVVAKNEGGEAVSCADLRVVQPLPDIGLNMLSTFVSNDNTDRVNVVSFYYFYFSNQGHSNIHEILHCIFNLYFTLCTHIYRINEIVKTF